MFIYSPLLNRITNTRGIPEPEHEHGLTYFYLLHQEQFSNFILLVYVLSSIYDSGILVFSVRGVGRRRKVLPKTETQDINRCRGILKEETICLRIPLRTRHDDIGYVWS